VRRAAIVAPVRTAVGTFGGALGPLRAEDRAMEAIRIHLHPGRGGGI
jgi:acetyl-CoA C-acetyltransferase